MWPLWLRWCTRCVFVIPSFLASIHLHTCARARTRMRARCVCWSVLFRVPTLTSDHQHALFTAASSKQDVGVLNFWLQNIREVRRLHRDELKAIEDDDARHRRLVELNVGEQVLAKLLWLLLLLSFPCTG